jgi:hypothetical protein
MNKPAITGDAITRGVCRLLRELGYEVLTEFRLRNGRRADVIGLDRAGRFVIAEVKASIADFQADRKWQEYVPFCDRFYFAVATDFPRDILPAGCGVIVADRYGGTVLAEAMPTAMAPARRKTLVLGFARTAGARLAQVIDPPVA